MLLYLVTSPNKRGEDKGYVNEALIPITKNFIFQLRKFLNPHTKKSVVKVIMILAKMQTSKLRFLIRVK